MTMLRVIKFTIPTILLITTLSAQAEKELRITVYNDGQGLVKTQLQRDLTKGVSSIELTDVASSLIPTTVKLSPVQNNTGIRIIEQNYRYDLVNQDQLLKKYLEANVEVVLQNGEKVTGSLLSYNGSVIILKTRSGTEVIQRLFVANIKCPEPQDRLYVKPTLSWLVESSKSGNYSMDLSYLTNGLTWKAEYVATLNDKEDNLNLSSWIDLNNFSGAAYQDAKLKLVAGTLHRAQESPQFAFGSEVRVQSMRAMPKKLVEERKFFDYHIYEVNYPVTIADKEEKQIQWLQPKDARVEKRYYYENGNEQESNLDVRVKFKNDKASGIGEPLPAGIVRVFKRDTDGALELVGEDKLDHTSVDDDVTLTLGEAFDVKGTRVVTNRESKREKFHRETVEITLKNRMDKESAPITVVENFWAYGEWEIKDHTDPFHKRSAKSIEFNITLAPKSEKTITYTLERDLR
ncbi:MAG TPA: hypothetical protein DHU63_03500 [Candidatus Marinimicrobia bacterium]|nr:MAG: hypothetical protein COY19_07740 [Candidatus Marinimicrobia bacterium CG_4_10_14_0_2_um_filter_48_9]PJA53388.1 MAG: hypothetical protein CO167_07485 [Candidatus Marinimicrobia bacterium CG_4_9_14_3_um_filter_48_9]HCW75584.1 hypothetical protein [Candidatus Neomarinimicrobiota bacterium]